LLASGPRARPSFTHAKPFGFEITASSWAISSEAGGSRWAICSRRYVEDCQPIRAIFATSTSGQAESLENYKPSTAKESAVGCTCRCAVDANHSAFCNDLWLALASALGPLAQDLRPSASLALPTRARAASHPLRVPARLLRRATSMAESHPRASNPLATTDIKRRRRLDQLTLDELRPLAAMRSGADNGARERWTPGRTARLARDARAARLSSDLPPSSSRARRQR